LASSKNPSVPGVSVTFTATVAPISGSGVPTGTVRFFDGATPLGQSSLGLTSGATRATLSTSALTAGTHSITAQYSGDASFGASATFAPLLQSVSTTTTAATTTSVTASPNPAPFNTAVTLTATVKGSGGGKGSVLSGTVQFVADGVVIGTGTLIAGKNSYTATLGRVLLPRGAHAIVAQYLGNSSYSPSTSETIPLQVQ
jgi:hypothetical protein